MPIKIISAAVGLTAALLLLPLPPARAAEPIVIGDLTPVTRYAEGARAYANGYALALEEVNAAGGAWGRPLRVLARDDFGDPGKAVQVAQELVSRDRVALLTGTFHDHVGLAVSDFAKRNRILFLKGVNGTNRHIWQLGHRYAFRFDACNYFYAEVLAEEAAKLPGTRWVSIAPNIEFGHSFVEEFKRALAKRRPAAVFVRESWPALDQITGGAEVQAMMRAKPDAMLNVLYGSNLINFLREARARGFEKCPQVAAIAGWPEELEVLGAEAPVGWITQGYPYDAITAPEHKKFLQAYRARFGKDPRWSSIVGYCTLKSVAAAIAQAGTTETEALVTAMEQLKVQTPLGPVTYRAIDHQSTVGAFIGKTGFVNGKPTLVDWTYKRSDTYMPSDEEVRKLRPRE